MENTGVLFHRNFNSILRRDHPVSTLFLLIKPNRAYVERFQEQCQTNAPGKDARYINQAAVPTTACL